LNKKLSLFCLPKSLPLLALKTATPYHKQRICSLIAMPGRDDQQFIAQRLLTKVPAIELIYCSTADETLSRLDSLANEYYNFPGLLLLNLEIATRPIAWQLLEQIRTRYLLLPVVLISEDGQIETIRRAYDSGSHSFIHKSMDWSRWEEQLASLADYWLQVVNLPQLPPL